MVRKAEVQCVPGEPPCQASHTELEKEPVNNKQAPRNVKHSVRGTRRRQRHARVVRVDGRHSALTFQATHQRKQVTRRVRQTNPPELTTTERTSSTTLSDALAFGGLCQTDT